MKLTARLRLNGRGNAYLRELGCRCPQCTSRETRANTSASLVIEETTAAGPELRAHLLFDCGAGVVDSLIDAGLDRVTHLFLSHNHPDHLLETWRLAQSLRRSARRRGEPFYLPCFLTAGTRAAGLDRFYPQLEVERIEVVAGQVIEPCAGECGSVSGEPVFRLEVVPLLVHHGSVERVPEPVIWVVRYDVGEGWRTIVLAWDLLHLVPRYPEDDADAHYAGPTAVSLDPRHAVATDADLLVLEANTIDPHPETGHTSLRAAMRATIPRLRPRGDVWFVHYSGHEDAGGPRSEAALRAEIARLQAEWLPDAKCVCRRPDEGAWWS